MPVCYHAFSRALLSGAAERGAGPAKMQRDASGRARAIKPVWRRRSYVEESGKLNEIAKPRSIRRKGLYDHGRAIEAMVLRGQQRGGRPMNELIAQRICKHPWIEPQSFAKKAQALGLSGTGFFTLGPQSGPEGFVAFGLDHYGNLSRLVSNQREDIGEAGTVAAGQGDGIFHDRLDQPRVRKQCCDLIREAGRSFPGQRGFHRAVAGLPMVTGFGELVFPVVRSARAQQDHFAALSRAGESGQ